MSIRTRKEIPIPRHAIVKLQKSKGKRNFMKRFYTKSKPPTKEQQLAQSETSQQ